MEIRIRKGKIDDAVQLIKHLQIVLGESNFMLTAPEEYHASIEKQEKWLKEFEKDGHLLLVAEVGNSIIGMLDFERCNKKRISHVGYLSISIQEEYCNQGIGHKLMVELLEYAKEHPDIEKVCLEVFSHNERAIHFYKKLGFKEEGRKVRFVRFEDGTYVDEIEMYTFV
ncbi:GNAT family N-acetyltransferase [Bacillus sp. PS06]|uniref:GNAT family N-acetyltransferase n=1 Tax=Bacillus sp. PS06 TaxID=2764176 RepID=UPI001781CC75|nr:GNAT family protein [Bacillus sp. PS06]MBD8067579.1 GNAT family N-acetyltransferase [Bacillus sp. PS06]